jgi:hypothetical protein
MAEPMSSAPAMVRSATAIGLAALAIGLLAQFLFVDAALGINVPIATAALIGAGWMIRDRSTPMPRWPDLWLAPGALILSVFVALRGDGTLVALDILGAMALTGAALASFGGLRMMERHMAGIVSLAGRLALSGLVAGTRPLVGLLGAVPMLNGRAGSRQVAPIMRGLLIAAPLVLLFVLLFASADAVFDRIARDLFNWHLDLGSLPGRIAWTIVVAWLAAGLLMFVARGEDREPDPAAVVAWEGRRRLGLTEAVTVLVVLDLLFIGFVALQAAYLFGGQDTLEASGLTYASYARRGFFELLAAAFVVGGLVLALETFVTQRTRAYLAGVIGLVALTLAVLSSALLRLRLYQDAYGWTELRFYVLAAIIWLAIGAVVAIVALAGDRARWLLHGMLVLSLAFGLAFNVIGPVRFIADQNVERAVHPELVAQGGETGLDVYYLASLGDDALPVLADGLCFLPGSLGGEAFDALRIWTDRIVHDKPGRAWQAWNLSRERAREIGLSEFCLLFER